jgi:hypothetical protein
MIAGVDMGIVFSPFVKKAILPHPPHVGVPLEFLKNPEKSTELTIAICTVVSTERSQLPGEAIDSDALCIIGRSNKNPVVATDCTGVMHVVSSL